MLLNRKLGLLGLVLDTDIIACIVYLSGEGRERGGERCGAFTASACIVLMMYSCFGLK